MENLFIAGSGHFTLWELCDQFAYRHPGAWMMFIIYLVGLNMVKGFIDAVATSDEKYDSSFEKFWRVVFKAFGYQIGIRPKKGK